MALDGLWFPLFARYDIVTRKEMVVLFLNCMWSPFDVLKPLILLAPYNAIHSLNR